MTPAPRPDDPPEDRARRVVLMGLGRRGGEWLAALASPGAAAAGLALVGVCDPDPERGLAALAAAGRAVPVGGDLRALLDLSPDLVVDAGGPGTRLAVARAALGSGAHLLCDPPLAADDETARILLGLAGRGPARLSVAHATRPLDGARALAALAASGRLGRPLTLRVELRAERGAGAPGPLHEALRGPALDAFDAARRILDAEPLEVRCVERGAEAAEGEARHGGSEVHAVFDMTGGAVLAVAANLREAGPPAPEAGRWRLVLSAGAAHWEGAGPVAAWALGSTAPIAAPDEEPDQTPDGAPHEVPARAAGAAARLRTLRDAARGGGPAAASLQDAAASLSMALAAIRSARSGGRPEPVRPLGLVADRTSMPAPRSPAPRSPAPRPPVPTTREAP